MRVAGKRTKNARMLCSSGKYRVLTIITIPKNKAKSENVMDRSGLLRGNFMCSPLGGKSENGQEIIIDWYLNTESPV